MKQKGTSKSASSDHVRSLNSNSHAEAFMDARSSLNAAPRSVRVAREVGTEGKLGGKLLSKESPVCGRT